MRGGPQEEGRRAGTENVAGILSMVVALEVREALLRPEGQAAPASSPDSDSFHSEAVQLRLAWRDAFIERMRESLPEVEVAGLRRPRLWNTVSALMPDVDSQQRWVVKLDKLGFAVSTGSACSSGKEEPSHVIAAMGYLPNAAGRVLRFSSGWETIEADWQALLEGLQKVHRGMSKP
jgi:cysteine desulfurase